MRRRLIRWGFFLLPVVWTVLFLVLPPALLSAAAPSEGLQDLTGLASVQALFKEQERFGNIYQYEVRIINHSPDPLDVSSLVVVLDSIANPSGENTLDRMNVLDPDGVTDDGNPFFRIPSDKQAMLPPYGESDPVLLRIGNPDSLPLYLFTLGFRVLGLPRLTPSGSLQALVDLLIEKGFLTRDEWKAALEGAHQP